MEVFEKTRLAEPMRWFIGGNSDYTKAAFNVGMGGKGMYNSSHD